MQSTDIPAAFPVPFASGAGGAYIRAIPVNHVAATSTDAPASLHDGFPPETFRPLASGGIPPAGEDFNGILNQLSAWARWLKAGVPAQYDASFSAAINGYPKSTILVSATSNVLWQSTAENNTTNPDSGSAANWSAIAAPLGTDPNFYRLPNGKVEQWGYIANSTTGEPSVPVTLVTPFANAAYNVSLTPSINAAGNRMDTWVQVVRGTKTTTGFSVQYQSVDNQAPGLDGFEWRCVGQGA